MALHLRLLLGPSQLDRLARHPLEARLYLPACRASRHASYAIASNDVARAVKKPLRK